MRTYCRCFVTRLAMAQLGRARRLGIFHELSDDWRVGAAWFESQLLNFDVYSNQGNWLHLAGLGTDPRGYLGGRWFYPKNQARQHDADGNYQKLWHA